MKKKPLYDPDYSRSIAHLFESLSAEDVAAQMVARANVGDGSVRQWLDRFVTASKPRKGLVKTLYTDEALEDAIDAAADVHLVISPTLGPKRTVKWAYAYLPGEKQGDVHATALLRVVQEGLLDRIRYCKLAECGTLFFGDKRAQWCSKSCGSKYRQRVHYQKRVKK